MEIKRTREYNRRKRGGREEENWRKYRQQKELAKQLIRREREEHERTMTREIKDAKDSGMKIWRMIDKLKGTKREGKEQPLYDDSGLEVEKARVHGEMMNYWSSICKKENNEMMREWGGRDREEYCNLWHQMSEVGGIVTIRYNNTEIYERVPEHLMRDLDVQQGRM